MALAPGQLSLGLAIPSEFDALSPDPQLLVAYVMNNGGYTSQDTELALDIPNDFQVLQVRLRFQ